MVWRILMISRLLFCSQRKLNMIHALVCLRCNFLVTHDPKKLSGCTCDPDAPTWVAIEPDGRVLKMSGAEYMALSDEE
jgi:hypothetical protein